MLKLHSIFLRRFIIIFFGLFLILGVVFYFFIKEVFIEQTKIDLLHNVSIFSSSIENFDGIDEKVTDDVAELRVFVAIASYVFPAAIITSP